MADLDDESTTLSDHDVELARQLYEEGLSMPRQERRRRGLGYKGLALKFEIPVRTMRCILTYKRRYYRT